MNGLKIKSSLSLLFLRREFLGIAAGNRSYHMKADILFFVGAPSPYQVRDRPGAIRLKSTLPILTLATFSR
jgi:hypothetical protein